MRKREEKRIRRFQAWLERTGLSPRQGMQFQSAALVVLLLVIAPAALAIGALTMLAVAEYQASPLLWAMASTVVGIAGLYLLLVALWFFTRGWAEAIMELEHRRRQEVMRLERGR